MRTSHESANHSRYARQPLMGCWALFVKRIRSSAFRYRLKSRKNNVTGSFVCGRKKRGAHTLERLTHRKKRGESQSAKPGARCRRLVEGDLSRRDVYTEKLRDASWMTARSSAEQRGTVQNRFFYRVWIFIFVRGPFHPLKRPCSVPPLHHAWPRTRTSPLAMCPASADRCASCEKNRVRARFEI